MAETRPGSVGASERLSVRATPTLPPSNSPTLRPSDAPLPFTPDLLHLSGKRVTLLGLGLFGGGVGAARWLARRGARITVTDLRPEKELAESIEALRDVPATFHLGGHREEDFTGADLVIVSPAIPLGSPFLRAAADAGVPLETEINLAFKLCPAPVVGITGSNGKSTTTALAGALFRAAGERVWVGGNLGGSPLDWIDQVRPDDRVVLELSSFQLDNLGAIGRSPRVAVVTNLTPNHLDRHGTMAAYAEAKRQVFVHQRRDGHVVLNGDDPALGASFRAGAAGTVWEFAASARPARGARIAGETVAIVEGGKEKVRIDAAARRIIGQFNLANVAAAATAAWILRRGGVDAWRKAVEGAVAKFAPLEHRLEPVAAKRGVRWINDSKSTDPEALLEALGALEGTLVLIAGGYDKKTPFDALARRIVERAPASGARVRRLVLIGDTAPAIARAVEAAGGGIPVETAAHLEAAVAAAAAAAEPGDAVLLSPACASFGLFRNYAERGRLFKEAVARLPA